MKYDSRSRESTLLASALYGSDYMPFLIQTEEPLFPFSHSSISFFFNNFNLVSFAIDNSRTWAFRFKWFFIKIPTSALPITYGLNSEGFYVAFPAIQGTSILLETTHQPGCVLLLVLEAPLCVLASNNRYNRLD
jgi:hypothetical protein